MESTRAGRLRISIDLITQIAKNVAMGSSLVRKWRLQRPRSATSAENLTELIENHAFYGLDLLRENIDDLTGKSVCEIGPGDNLASGLSILAAGASRYCVIDRFPGDYFSDNARRWYRKVRENWEQFYPGIAWNEVLDASAFPEGSLDRLEIIREPIETARTERRYDIVCSFQVGEHVSDIEAFAEIHNRVLANGGIGLHRVDFGPHDCWFSYKDPTTFLRFSDSVWKLTGSNRGVPNRKRHHEFLEAFVRANLNVEVVYQVQFDQTAVDLSKLHSQFHKMPAESVMTACSVYKVTRKEKIG